MDMMHEQGDELPIALVDDTLHIPDGVATPCTTNSMLFTDSALDPDPDWWTTLDAADRHDVAMAKDEAQRRAVTQCRTCPILDQCHEWAMRVDVFGVAGGTIHAQRHEPDAVDAYIAEGAFPDREELVRIWLNKGWAIAEIAERLGAPAADVSRIRDRIAAKARRAALGESGHRFARVSPATAAMYEALASAPGPQDRETVLAAMIAHVDEQEARERAPKGRDYPNEAARIAAGARRYALNLIRIAIRGGKVVEQGETDGAPLLAMAPAAADTWRAWQQLQTAS